MTRSRALAAGIGAAAVLALAIAVAPDLRPARDSPTIVGVVVLAVLVGGWPATRRWIAPATGVVVAVTLTGLVNWLAAPTIGGGIWSLELTAVLMVLLALVCRWASPAWALTVGTAGVVTESMLVLQTTGAPVMRGWEAVGACVFWSLAGLVGVGAGLYLRILDVRRISAITAARRAQSVRLAADLHDGVAHDVSAMVLQAQAARVLLGDRAAEVARVLDRIETDGTRALASMQQSIRVLRDQEGGRPAARLDETPPSDLDELVAQHPEARFDVDPGPEPSLIRRAVAEALRNARKHADEGAVVRLRRPAGAIALTVTNPLPATPRPDTPGLRYGLAGLADEAVAAGGTFSAGPDGDQWILRLELPS